jgi:tetratricopeptide (TPR) repeat protein
MSSKEIAATLPFFILLYEWYFFQDLSKAWLKRALPYMIGILMLFGLLVFLYLGSNPLEAVLSGYKTWYFTLTERLLTELRVVIYYISLLLYPHPSRLSLDYDFAISHSLTDPITTLISMGVIVGLIGIALYIAKRQRLISFCIFWFFGNLTIESSIIALDLVFEHRTYLPSMFFFLIIVVLAYRYIRRDWAIIGVLVTIILLFSLWTHERNNVWNDPVSFWKASTEQSKNKPRSLINLGLALAKQGSVDEAIAYYLEALRIDPEFAPAHNNLGLALAGEGKLDQAIVHYSEALRIRGDYPEAQINLGNALAGQGKLDEAIAHYSKTLQYEEGHYNLARALVKQEKIDEAIYHYSEALRIRPDYAKAHYGLGLVVARQGKMDEAVACFSEALRIRPDYAEAHYNLGVAFVQQGYLDEATAHYSEALRLKPDYAEAHNNLGIVLAQEGKLDSAITHFSEALRIRPEYAAAHANLGRALEKAGKSPRASSNTDVGP